jgi:glucose-1-phosphate adenylyltransferase
MPWGFARPDGRIQLLHPYLAREEGRDWYKGTADAVYQNLQYIQEQEAELVLILSGDHVYKMDYNDMVDFHHRNQADVTLAVTRLPRDELIHFGTVTVDENQQIIGFQEKVKEPKSDLVSMGVYVFQRELLQQILEDDAQRRSSKHDFGRNIFPQIVGNCRLFAYNFEGYWRDVGTIRSYWEANMRLLDSPPSISFTADWPIRTQEDEPRAPAIISRRGDVVNSMISHGCVIEGRVENSILSPGVRVAANAVVKYAVIMNDTVIGRESVVDFSILDKDVVVEAGSHVGTGNDYQVNREEPLILNTGLTVVGKGAKIPEGIKIGHNCAIAGGVTEKDFRGSIVQSGETINPKRHRSARKE